MFAETRIIEEKEEYLRGREPVEGTAGALRARGVWVYRFFLHEAESVRSQTCSCNG